jgi:hypothetical protein
MQEKKTRLESAEQVAQELLDEMERGSASIADSLMKAKRLARVLRDDDAKL